MTNSHKQIVFVDDDEDMAPIYQIAAETAGFEPIIFNKSPEALEYLAKHKVDAVVLDLMMPSLDGLDLALQMRKNEKVAAFNPAVIVFYTGHHLTQRIEEVMDEKTGADVKEFIKKPTDPAELIETVKGWLNAK